MEDKRVADYFVVAGLPAAPEPWDDTTLSDGGNLKATHGQAPITDISVIFPSLEETLPEGYVVVRQTPSGLSADLNHGSLRAMECFLCYRRGRDKPPLIDIGVIYEGKEILMKDAELVSESVGGHVANVNNSTAQTFLTYRRGADKLACNALVVTDVCVIIANKGETAPHAFCCIKKNLNKGLMGNDVFLCYKKSMNRAKLLTYKPSVLSRYPEIDHLHFPFPHSVPLFCLPMGATLELWPEHATKPSPLFSSFVLTVSDAKYKVYGSSVTFYEQYPVAELTEMQRRQLIDCNSVEETNANGQCESNTAQYESLLFVNKSICLLSHWPFTEAFQSWLLFLHSMVTSGQPSPISIERYIIQLLNEVPFPSPRTLLELSSPFDQRRVIMIQPEDVPLPRSAAGFRHLLTNLGPENCLLVLLLVLTEQKILVHSLRPDTLTAVAEALSTMLFPFKWQCPYIPLCPLSLVEVLHAPLPFLIGVDSRFFDLYDPPADVSCIDLDTNIITIPEPQRNILNIKLLPKRATKLLKAKLDILYTQLRHNMPIDPIPALTCDVESEFRCKERDHIQELEIQEAFLIFMALTLKGYRNYLLPITKAPTVGTTDPQALFQLNDFLKSRDKQHQRFFTLLMRTQMFIRFIEERSFVADGDQGLAFFDECTEKLSHDDVSIRLIELESIHRSDRTVFILPPEPSSTNVNGDDQPFAKIYHQFTLDPDLLKPRLGLECINSVTTAPGSPMVRRTKHEIKSAQKLARKCVTSPDSWARCLCGTCYTLYFMVLPSLLITSKGNESIVIQQAYDLLVRATQYQLPCDEVCFRLMMQLCREHSRPLLAVKLLVLMKKYGIQPNALTYGLYNRCVLEAEWSASCNSSQLLWNKLRNVVIGAAQFRRAVKKRRARELSAISIEGGTSLLENSLLQPSSASDSKATSHLSLNNCTNEHDNGVISNSSFLMRKVWKAATNIVKGISLNGSEQSLRVDDAIDDLDSHEKNIRTNHLINNDATVNQELTMTDGGNEICGVLEYSNNDLPLTQKTDSIEDDRKKTCVKVLNFDKNCDNSDNVGSIGSPESLQSPSKTSPRTVVTENDPLGALDEDEDPVDVQPVENSPETPKISSNILTVDPILFRSPVHKSATFDDTSVTNDDTLKADSKIHRSETLPASTVASSLSHFGTSFKMGFSPSALTAKKSNELLQGGLSSIKSAANTMAKKLDEIKEAISTNSTPLKSAISHDKLASGDNGFEGHCHCAQHTVTCTNPYGVTCDCESNDGSSEGGDRHRKISAEVGLNCAGGANSYRGSSVNLKDWDDPLPECPFVFPNEPKPHEISGTDLLISMTSCSQCHNCSCLLYDEDIMASWFADDSNLNTACVACGKPTVPFLTITIPNSHQCDSPFSVPYLNPLVLRKELENIVQHEGELSLSHAEFVDKHPIIYWNLVWAFERIQVHTHLPSLCLKESKKGKTLTNGINSNSAEKVAPTSNKNVLSEASCVSPSSSEGDSFSSSSVIRRPVEDGADPLTQELLTTDQHVVLRCFWDEPKFHADYPSMYMLWNSESSSPNLNASRSTITKSFMQDILLHIRANDLIDPLQSLTTERELAAAAINNSGSGSSYPASHSMYRDILFLACKAIGRAHIDLNAFDRQYIAAYVRITERYHNCKLFAPQDRPISLSALFCRQYFRPLILP